MKRRDLFKAAGVLAAAPMLNLGRCYAFGRELPVRALDLVQGSLVIDMLGLITMDWPDLYRWHKNPNTFTKTDFQTLAESGVDVFHPAVDLNTTTPYEDTVAWLQDWARFLEANKSFFVPVRAADDLVRRNGRKSVLLGMQNASHFRTPSDVALFYAMGQRLSQLTYNDQNRLGSGCLVADRGLTAFGGDIVSEMNRLGMAIDVSHAGERTTLEAFEASSQPVLITHSNCKHLSGHPRCKSDQVIRRMARSGGVLGIACVPAFLRSAGQVSLNDALDHFDHAIRVAGVEHVGLGTDLDVQERKRQTIAGLNQPLHIFAITEGLLRRGYTNSHIEAILGGNFKRALASIYS